MQCWSITWQLSDTNKFYSKWPAWTCLQEGNLTLSMPGRLSMKFPENGERFSCFLPTSPTKAMVVGYLFSFTSLNHRGSHQMQREFTGTVWKHEWQIQRKQESIIFHLILNTILYFKIINYGTVNVQCLTETGFAFHLHRFLLMHKTHLSFCCCSGHQPCICFQCILKL